MPSTGPRSPHQRGALAPLLQTRVTALQGGRATQLHGRRQFESARQTLLQDADDGRQRAGAHEVEGIVSDIDSREFNEIQHALQRLQGSDYGLCSVCAAIPFERLKLEPQALRCTACPTLHERKSSP